ncbi:hypothetical protein PHLGIDRAFT_18295 [Phlebiopsis gigantea 11061_1 CR5-6]|uniref:DUF6533 domain-containing protein n=1 Tax=Phlebiopsis gigantea (strain 11061_1 CR5-6) TaxID=745531 RepID=A0A0C3SEG1_PHLG1|nr:hypothetical protein PHLGIDRAFT_18295 [Phlebiopsis gigantea 11061_1 CR5-6]
MFRTPDTGALNDSLTLANEGSVQDYAVVSLAALILYDHVITFSDEVELFWRHKLTVVDGLFYLNRYTTLLFGVINSASGHLRQQESCVEAARVLETIMALLMLVSGLCSALRVYALWNRNISLAFVTLSLNIIPIVVTVYQYAASHPVVTTVPFATCITHIPFSNTKQLQLIVINRVCCICTNLLVLAVIWWKTFHAQLYAYKAQLKVPVTTVLIRDGTSHLLAILMMNIAQLVAFRTTGGFYLSSFICLLTAILDSRFFLALRQAATGHLDSHTSEFDEFSHADLAVIFATSSSFE